ARGGREWGEGRADRDGQQREGDPRHQRAEHGGGGPRCGGTARGGGRGAGRGGGGTGGGLGGGGGGGGGRGGGRGGGGWGRGGGRGRSRWSRWGRSDIPRLHGKESWAHRRIGGPRTTRLRSAWSHYIAHSAGRA